MTNLGHTTQEEQNHKKMKKKIAQENDIGCKHDKKDHLVEQK